MRRKKITDKEGTGRRRKEQQEDHAVTTVRGMDLCMIFADYQIRDCPEPSQALDHDVV